MFHTVEPLESRKRCIWLHEAPIRMSPWVMDDDPLAKIDNGLHFQENEAAESSGTGPGSSRVRSKDPRFDLSPSTVAVGGRPHAHARAHFDIAPFSDSEKLKFRNVKVEDRGI